MIEDGVVVQSAPVVDDLVLRVVDLHRHVLVDVFRVQVELALVLVDRADEFHRALPLKVAPGPREARGREEVDAVLSEVAEQVAVSLEDDADLVLTLRVIAQNGLELGN